jgi:hypothetical protein
MPPRIILLQIHFIRQLKLELTFRFVSIFYFIMNRLTLIKQPLRHKLLGATACTAALALAAIPAPAAPSTGTLGDTVSSTVNLKGKLLASFDVAVTP